MSVEIAKVVEELNENRETNRITSKLFYRHAIGLLFSTLCFSQRFSPRPQC
jgi:hypothetical protein